VSSTKVEPLKSEVGDTLSDALAPVDYRDIGATLAATGARGSDVAGVLTALAPPTVPVEEQVDPALLGDLDDPELVISLGYIGRDRRGAGFRARILRSTFGQRRAIAGIKLLMAVALAVVVVTALLLVGFDRADPETPAKQRAPFHRTDNRLAGTTATPKTSATPASTPATSVPAVAGAGTSTPAVASAPTTTVRTTTTTPPPVTPAVTPAATPAATPAQMGAEALALVRYPWQSIPGYTINFYPSSDAPEPGFYGNTTDTWGQSGGTSDLYIYPGETVQQLAGITAFEIGHEVDAAEVYPQGGHTQIENILGIFPASWAPNCDCAEQNYLSGWYAAAFSNYWSPGVGNWSQIAPEPSGAVLAAIEPWLNPSGS
jgi:hypothetical protein